MKTVTILGRGAAAAVVTSLLLLAPVHPATAAGGGDVKAPTSGTKAPVPSRTVSTRDHRTPPLVRDHRGQVRKDPRSGPICAGWAC